MEISRKALVEQPSHEKMEEDVVDDMDIDDITILHQSGPRCVEKDGEVKSIDLVDVCSDGEDKELLVFLVREETDSDSSALGTGDEHPIAISMHLMSPLTRKKQHNTVPKSDGKALTEMKPEKESEVQDTSNANIDNKVGQTDFQDETAKVVDCKEDEVQVKTEEEFDQTYYEETALEVDYLDDSLQVKTEEEIDQTGCEDETALAVDQEQVKMKKMNRKRHPCDVCGKDFTAPCHLKVHLRMHTGERPFACTLCTKSFKRKSHLEDHQRTHGNEKKYVCGICKGSFPHPSSLSRHLRLHSSRYLCHMCGKSFELKTGLVNHIALECGEKPEVDSIKESNSESVNKVCWKNKVKQDPSNKQVSTKTKHSSGDSVGKSSPNGVDQVTNNKTRNKRNPGGGRHSYKWYIDSYTDVLGDKRYLCSVCNKVYSDEAMYRIHELMHKDISAYSCDVCEKSFSDVSILEIHMRTHNM